MEALVILMLFLTIGFLIGSNFLITEKENVPSVKLSSLEGTTINARNLINDDKPIIVVFWEPSEKNFRGQFEQMMEAREQIMGKKQARIVAIYDNPQSNSPLLKQDLKQYLEKNNMNIEVYIDKHGKMRSEMNIPEVPYTMVFGQNQSINFHYFGLKINNSHVSFEARQPKFIIH